MKVLSIFISCLIFLTNGKFIGKYTEKNYDSKPTKSQSSQRFSRQAFYDEGIGLSIEDYNRNYVIRKERYSVKNKYSEEDFTENIRVSRDSAEKPIKTKNPDDSAESKPLKVLVMKPITKFNVVDYDDFQVKVNALTTKVSDSGEHEDEDFNLDDYEFDVNHDEFTGRGKPLEPRVKYKSNKDSTERPKSRTTTESMPEIKIQYKVVNLTSPSPYVKRNAVNHKAADKMKEDYYDDIEKSTKVPDTTTKEPEEDFSDEFDSKEFIHRSRLRNIRSPGNVRKLRDKRKSRDKIGSQNANVVAKVLAFLPLFPQLPNSNEEKDIDVPN